MKRVDECDWIDAVERLQSTGIAVNQDSIFLAVALIRHGIFPVAEPYASSLLQCAIGAHSNLGCFVDLNGVAAALCPEVRLASWSALYKPTTFLVLLNSALKSMGNFMQGETTVGKRPVGIPGRYH